MLKVKNKIYNLIKSKKIVAQIIFFIFSIFSYTIPLSQIKEIKKLENYNEIKNIEVRDIGTYGENERKDGLLYEKGKNIPIDGVVVRREKNKIKALVFYKNGKAEGNEYNYYLNGNLRMKVLFQNDKKNGEKKQWRENGTLYFIAGYKDDKLISFIEYNEDGKTISVRYEITGDRVEVTVYDKSGKVKEAFGEGKILNHETIATIEDGIVQSFYSNGKIKTDVLMKDGKGNGPLKTYYEDGTLQLETFVENGKIKGPLAYYYISGNVQLKMDYLEGISNADGIINGNVEIYNKNGSIQYKGYFDNVKVSMLLKGEYGDIKNNREFIKLLKRFM